MARNLFSRIELLIIIGLACVPLFISFPYRVNIFLSWEGAYRISQGQLPFRDFGTPLGGMYWAIPAFFFKLFGPKMITLIKAQVFINIIAGLSFRSILGSLSVNKGIRLAAVVLFCISYSFFNFWPWYNHTVIVYELIALAFIFRYIANYGSASVGRRPAWYWLILSAFFVCCSFLTKQDGGGMTFLIARAILACYGLTEKKWMPLVVFAVSFFALLGLIIIPFIHFGFGYWFNHGQPPHTARVSAYEIAGEFLGSSQWIKFYFFLSLMAAFARFRTRAALLADKKGLLLLVLTWGILGEAAIFQVTSYTLPDNNIFFHSFAFACIFSLLAPLTPIDFGKARVALVLTAGVLLWWSGSWWKYGQRIVDKAFPHHEEIVSATGENVVNRSTYQNGVIARDTTEVPQEEWIQTGLRVFDKIYMPPSTVAGIHRLLDMPLLKRHRPGLSVLNMSELTPLAEEIPYPLERNPKLPLWHHLGVGMFNSQAELYEGRIRDHYYDLVLFEFVPGLNNFYPFRVRDVLRQNYRQVDSFLAPRRGGTQGTIEVYVRPDR